MSHDPVVVESCGDVKVALRPVPGWWIGAFAVTIAFALGYWLLFERYGVPGPLDRYLTDRAAALDTGEVVTEEGIEKLAADPLSVRAGAGAFGAHCKRCHGERGEGQIGPNLTDSHWLGSGAATDIYDAILNGRAGKGMPAWGLQLGPGMCKQLAAFVLTLRNQNLPGRHPEGKEWNPQP